MAIEDRQPLYQELERVRGRPLIVYVTSDRQNASGGMGGDVVRELHYQLEALPDDAEALDLLLVSNGGDPTTAWRIVSLIRERVKKFGVLVPQSAYSAATLLALGADEVVMHPNGNLGPTDPQITGRRSGKDGARETIQFGSEDLGAFNRYVREELGITDQAHIAKLFQKFCEDVGAVPIGVAARSSMLSISMGEKLLQLHMSSEKGQQKARSIAERLTKDFFHHGYAVSRGEAKQIGLNIAADDEQIESLIWRIWRDIEDELQMRTPFSPVSILKNDPACAAIFGAAQQLQAPANLPQGAAQNLMQQAVQAAIVNVPGATYSTTHAVMESGRFASRYIIDGLIFGARLPDLQLKISNIKTNEGWRSWP